MLAIGLRASCATLALIGCSGLAHAQTPPSADEPSPQAKIAPQYDAGTGDIIVTAQRQSQAINSVPMSITALSGDALLKRGVSNPEDLVKAVPGLAVAHTSFSIPIYSLRGVGFTDTALGSASTVAVYVDETPLPYPAMTTGAAFDLERIEVLKGPQGTLYGSNSTGGAINYISAKPTDHFSAGADLSYGRFNQFDGQFFVSGPITSNVKARLAGRMQLGSDWQYNYNRDDSAGQQYKGQAKLLLEWNPTSSLKVLLNANGWFDKSDTQRAQAIQFAARSPTNFAQLTPDLQNLLTNQPLAPHDNRAADWPQNFPGHKFENNNYFYQYSARIDQMIGDAVTLTSLTSYERLKIDTTTDVSGVGFNDTSVNQNSFINAFTQELRLTAELGRFRLIAGANYQWDKIKDTFLTYFAQSTASRASGLPLTSGLPRSASVDNNYAGFANAEFKLTNNLKLQGGVRYTQNKRDFSGCGSDSGNGQYAAVINRTILLLTGSPPAQPAVAGGCITTLQTGSPGLVVGSLNEHNVSWRAGVDFTLPNKGILYANVSRGYKQGAFPTVGATSYTQFFPATQEKLTAYEGGFKMPLFDHTLQVNGAAYYYDYRDKQVLGSAPDPIFKTLRRLINVPKSRVYGFEGGITWNPRGALSGLTASGQVTYSDTKILGSFVNVDPLGVTRDLGGGVLPYAPKWSAVGDAEYDWQLGNDWKAFVGTTATYHSSSNAGLGNIQGLRIDPYTLIDLRAGVILRNGTKITIWGRNVTNKYYWTNATYILDYFARYTGAPATYGASVSLRF